MRTALLNIALIAISFPVGFSLPQAQAEKIGEKSFIYSPVGKRDPFRPPAATPSDRDIASHNPLEQYSIEQMQLRAILRTNDGKGRAMFEDPEGRTHILAEGEIFGREKGTLSKILNNEVIVTERTFNYLGAENLYEKVISLPQK